MDNNLPVNPVPPAPEPIDLSPMPEAQPNFPQPTPKSPPPTPPTPPEPDLLSPEEPKPNNSLLLGIVVILLILALGAVGYLLFQNLQLKNQVGQPQPTLVSSPTPTPDPTIDWKTYTNGKYGFSFKYPNGYKVEEKVPGFVVLTLLNESTPQGGISFEARLQKPYDSLLDADEHIRSSLTISQETKIGEWKVFQGVGKEEMIKGIEFRQAIISYKTGVLEAETIATSSYISIFDQILATFELLAPSPSPEASSSASPVASPSASPAI